ncbi:MAG: DUF1800 family protein [Planctomycetota bacterium]|nr:DUF1800 family protein [Planctomycetota bacterium]
MEPSRRAVLKGGALGAAAAGLVPSALARAPQKESYEEHLFLLDRATWGYTTQGMAELRSMGWEDWLEWQLDWENIDDSVADGLLANVCPTSVMTPWEIYQSFSDLPTVTIQMAQLTYPLYGWYTRRQLFYRMAEFWSNVLNTYVGMTGQEWLWGPYTAGLKPHALGNFRDLLQASAEGASMLFYLNQDQSDKDSPIQNYARELLELHTFGLSNDPSNPTYNETDMLEAARILTGWTFQPNGNGSFGDFHFDDNNHDFTPKRFQGVDYPSTGGPGKAEGDDLLTQLAGEYKTALHIAKRLIGHFITDHPPQAYIDGVAGAFHSSGGDIKATVRALFRKGIYLLPDTKKARRPLYLATALARATGGVMNGPGIVGHVQSMGYNPSHRATPDGFPTENEEWYDNLHPRLVFTAHAAHGGAGIKIADTKLDAMFPGPAGRYAAQANRSLAGGALPTSEVAQIQTALNAIDPALFDVRRDAIALVFASPTYQFHLA